MSGEYAEYEHRVTPLELFFDLVFVFAFTQVTTLLSDDPAWGGLGRGLRSEHRRTGRPLLP